MGTGLTPSSAPRVLRGRYEACSQGPSTAPGTWWVPTKAASIAGPQAPNPEGPSPGPHWLWDPQIRQRTDPSSGEMDVRPKVEKGQPGGQRHD